MAESPVVSAPKRPSVLIVDDEPTNIKIISEPLRADHDIFVATRGQAALDMAATIRPDIILLDIMMPGMDGYQVCARLKADPATRDIPVIFVTALGQEEDEARGLELGAIDYLVKPISPSIVRARVKNHLDLKLAREELARRNDELVEAAKLREDVDRIVRHDLKSPLTGIIGLPQVIVEEGGLSESQAAMVKMIEEAGCRMLTMINLSLDMFKMERGVYEVRSEPVEILATLRRIQRESQTLIRAKRVRLVPTMDGREVGPGEHFFVRGEELLVYSLLGNLVKNAIEASPHEGRVDIALSWDAAGGPAIDIRNDGAVPLGVRETFFEKYTTCGKRSGTGLGAYSARLIARTLGGDVAMRTSDEAGATTLTVSLPPGGPAKLP